MWNKSDVDSHEGECCENVMEVNMGGISEMLISDPIVSSRLFPPATSCFNWGSLFFDSP